MNDLISRQAAIDALDVLCQEHRYRIPGKRETYSPYNEAWQDALDRAEGAIGNLPSAQPETIRPAWKADDRYIKTMFWPAPFCPKCNHYLITGDNYCSVCGRHIDWSEDDE